MKDMTITAKVPAKDDKPELNGSLTVKAPESIEEAIQMYGGDAVLSNAISNWTVTLQGTVRGALRRGETQDGIQTRLGGSKMGVAATKAQIDPKQAFIAQYAAASPEERKKMIADLQAAAAK